MNHEYEKSFSHAWAVQANAAALGFDWPDIKGPVEKVREEAGELEDAVAQDNLEEARRELGDVLFASVNVARFLGVDPSDVLEECTERFKRRFAAVRDAVEKSGMSMESCSLEELDVHWEAAKKLETIGREKMS